MHKIYLLLRNNNQSGPYSLEELLQLSPQPNDLVWVEGRSAGWQYPYEIEALKPFIKTFPQQTDPAAPEHLPAQTNSKPAIAEKNLKEISALASHIYISLPAGTATASAFELSREVEESPEQKLEKKAEELQKRIKAFTEGKKGTEEFSETDTRYSRSLEDIKEEYATWLYQQKKKRNGLSKRKKWSIAAALTIALLVAGYFVAWKNVKVKSETTTSDPQLSVPGHDQTSHTEKPPTNVQFIKATETNFPNTSATILPEPKEAPVLNNPNVRKKAETKENVVRLPEIKKISFPAVTIQPNETPATTNENLVQKNSEIAISDNGIKSKTENSSAKQIQAGAQEPAARKPIKAETGYASMVQLVTVTENNPTGKTANSNTNDLELTVNNNSNQFLNTVAVDVFYYKADASLLQKRTLYFNNIQPKTSLSLLAPKQRRASLVRYQLGLISSESGLYYVR